MEVHRLTEVMVAITCKDCGSRHKVRKDSYCHKEKLCPKCAEKRWRDNLGRRKKINGDIWSWFEEM